MMFVMVPRENHHFGPWSLVIGSKGSEKTQGWDTKTMQIDRQKYWGFLVNWLRGYTTGLSGGKRSFVALENPALGDITKAMLTRSVFSSWQLWWGVVSMHIWKQSFMCIFFPGPKSIGNKISIDRNDLHIAGYLYHLLCTSPHGFFVWPWKWFQIFPVRCALSGHCQATRTSVATRAWPWKRTPRKTATGWVAVTGTPCRCLMAACGGLTFFFAVLVF